MFAVNIEVDAAVINTIDIADATAAAGDILFQFFSDGANIFNKASESLGGAAGEVVVDDGVKYTVTISPAEAKLLRGAALTYKMTKAVAVNPNEFTYSRRGMEQKGSGTITVDNLDPEEVLPPLNFTNGIRQKYVTANYVATLNDDSIFVTSAGEVHITLPDNARMVGKTIRVKKIGAGSVYVENSINFNIATLENEGIKFVEVEATPNNWQPYH